MKNFLCAFLSLSIVNYAIGQEFIQSPKNVFSSDSLPEVVITGTKTNKRKTESPIIVNVLTSKTMHDLQVCNVAEGLKFQPGLRVETDCQTCNYTQLRMNGLQGGYAQILINGRPIFSPLTGLYGLEQLPTNMIEKIETVRGGGSSLYGSSAIGGTVNIITKIPQKNTYEINSFYQNLNGQTNDFNLSSNISLVNKDKKAGSNFFLHKRKRGFYDANNDNFSEIPSIENTSLGINSFFLIGDNQKLEFSISHLNEYRFGGEMLDKPAYLTQQSEERNHSVWLGSSDYQIKFNDNQSSFLVYTAFQHTQRGHYTGIFPDAPSEIAEHLANPPYGSSNTTTLQAGMQYDHEINNFLGRKNVFSVGNEYIIDKVWDNIPSYQYLVDQQTKNWGGFLQSDWNILKNTHLLSGIRIDKHNLVSKVIFSPRVALLYKPTSNLQIRGSYGTGFRAPQSFDADLHIAFAGGGISRVQLAKDLREETSQSLSTSINYDKAIDRFIAGFTVEGFYTQLHNAFVLEHIGDDHLGEIFEKRNSSSATVKGVTIELRANYNKKMQLETGFTFQKSNYGQAIEHIKGVEPTTDFLRSPDAYGYANINITPNTRWNINLNYLYTGSMQIAHMGGADNFPDDKMIATQAFSELSGKVSYILPLPNIRHSIEIYTGVKNIFNAYQSDFDTGKNRDSNYIYGPSSPRTFLIGCKIKMP